MPHNFSGRVTVILLVLLAALWAIFPQPQKLVDPEVPLSQKHDLRPGIDMVGGTSLLYEIKASEDAPIEGNLAELVMESLKRRVDPDGVRNLIWRPHGENQLEIQMPLSARGVNAAEARRAYAQAQRQLEATNIRPSVVTRAVETGDTEALRELAMGSEKRQALFDELIEAYAKVKDAQEARNAQVQAEAELKYEELKSRIAETNLSVNELDATLSLSNAEEREKRLAELKAEYAGFPARLEAIEAYQGAYAAYVAAGGALDDASDLKRLLKGSGVLEFHILVRDYQSPEVQAMIERLQKSGPSIQAGDTMAWFQVDRPEEFGGPVFTWNDKAWALAYITPDKSMVNREGAPRWGLKRAYLLQQPGEQVVGFEFDSQGAILFAELTGANVGQQLATVLDKKIITAPNINTQISGSGYIDGGDDGFTQAELRYLINTLNAGSLPAQLADEPIRERTVGPQLGADNLKAGLYACYFGLAVVAVFLIGYYYTAGAVAMIAVLINLVLILGGMAMLNATFTLPAIAGIVLTIGMAVDANVLIFERLREEQQRGLSIRMALNNAYERAFSAILDGNVTTGITALVLYWFGSEEVRGFGITLLLGIVASLFTALYVTKTIFGILIDKFGLKKLGSLPLTFPAWDRALRPNIDWMSKAWIFGTFSAVFIVAGLVAFGIKLSQGRMLDIEFAEGTSIQFELKEPTPIDDVRRLLPENADTLPSPAVVAVGNDDRTYEVVTPNANATEVREVVLASLGDRLNIEVPSRFEMVGEPLPLALNQVVVPVTEDGVTIDEYSPPEAQAYVGGVAIHLRNLDPPLSPNEIRDRIERQRLQPQPGAETLPYREFTVVADAAPDQPATNAVVLVRDERLQYSQDQTLWREQLAGPMWKLVNEAVNEPPKLSRVGSFGPQVAGQAKQDATIALVMALIAIMAYIWIRFGNLKYGTATVIALLHDTLFTVAAIGFAHYLVDWVPGLAGALLIEPFRINLTVVAAILTVMGYSMNDTVVVFDRIRENRGKFGHVSRQIINDSINQTLSRTLLTGGTTMLTILLMYIIGGPGIHGFTFALLVGILVGTYSSIAIASPILLLGTRAVEEPAARRATVGQLQQA